MAEHQLPKLNTRVRFPSSAPPLPALILFECIRTRPSRGGYGSRRTRPPQVLTPPQSAFLSRDILCHGTHSRHAASCENAAVTLRKTGTSLFFSRGEILTDDWGQRAGRSPRPHPPLGVRFSVMPPPSPIPVPPVPVPVPSVPVPAPPIPPPNVSVNLPAELVVRLPEHHDYNWLAQPIATVLAATIALIAAAIAWSSSRAQINAEDRRQRRTERLDLLAEAHSHANEILFAWAATMEPNASRKDKDAFNEAVFRTFLIQAKLKTHGDLDPVAEALATLVGEMTKDRDDAGPPDQAEIGRLMDVVTDKAIAVTDKVIEVSKPDK